MSDPKDPTRWLEDPTTSSVLRDVLETRSGHDPAPGDLARLKESLLAKLPEGALAPNEQANEVPDATSNAAPVVAKATIVKGAIGIVVVALGAAQLSSWKSSGEPVRPAVVATAVASAPSLPTITSPSDLPSAPTSHGTAPTLVQASAEPSYAAPPRESESTMLARAHGLLMQGHPSDALKTVEEHARAYPKGSLEQERELIAIEALVKLHDTKSAGQRAEKFQRRFPDSSHLTRVRNLVQAP